MKMRLGFLVIPEFYTLSNKKVREDKFIHIQYKLPPVELSPFYVYQSIFWSRNTSFFQTGVENLINSWNGRSCHCSACS